MTDNEIHQVLNNHKTFDEQTLCYWYNKINERLNYLKPLLDELEKKQMKLIDVCKPLYQEVWQIKELKKILEQYKFNP